MALLAVNWSAPVAATAGTVLVGQCLVPNASGLYVVGTSANRASFGRCDGIAITSGDATNPVIFIGEGPVEANFTGLGTGTASWVRVSSTGVLERATVSGSDDVVGWCETTGRLHALFGNLTAAIVNGGGGSFTPPTGTGFVSVTAGALDAASIKVNLASGTYVTGTLAVANGGTGITSLGTGVATFLGTPSSANFAAAVTGETGTGGVVFDTSPTISAPTLSSTPVLSGASTSTSNDAKGTAIDVNPVHVQTTDATVTTLDSFTIASNSAVVVSWLVIGIKSDSSQLGAYSCTASFKNNAGTVAQVGTTTTTIIGESDAAWDCTVDNSTTTIRLRITGKAATTVQWTAILTRLTVIP